MDQVDIAIYNAVHDWSGGTKKLAALMGVSHQILINKVNPNNDTHKLTLKECIAIQLHTDSTAIHNAIGLGLGVHSLPANETDPISLMIAMLNADKEHGDISKALAEALHDSKFTLKEKQHCNEQIAEAITALQQLQTSLNEIPAGEIVKAVS